MKNCWQRPFDWLSHVVTFWLLGVGWGRDHSKSRHCDHFLTIQLNFSYLERRGKKWNKESFVGCLVSVTTNNKYPMCMLNVYHHSHHPSHHKLNIPGQHASTVAVLQPAGTTCNTMQQKKKKTDAFGLFINRWLFFTCFLLEINCLKIAL